MARSNALRRRFDIFNLASFGVIAFIALVILLLRKHSFLTAIVVGIGWAGVAHGLAWGIAEVLAPGWVIQWRQRLISGIEDWRKPVGRYFSEKLDATGEEPWKNSRARRRIRSLGTLLTALWLATAVVLILIPGLLDRLYSALLRLPP